MAYLIFHYKMELNYGCFYPAAEHPRDYLSARVLAAYDDGKIIAYDRNCLNEKFNERTICENISVTNQIDKIIKDNKWKIRFIPRNLGFWALQDQVNTFQKFLNQRLIIKTIKYMHQGF